MLYCEDSWHYWGNLVPCTGLLRGALLKGTNWVGRLMGWAWYAAATKPEIPRGSGRASDCRHPLPTNR